MPVRTSTWHCPRQFCFVSLQPHITRNLPLSRWQNFRIGLGASFLSEIEYSHVVVTWTSHVDVTNFHSAAAQQYATMMSCLRDPSSIDEFCSWDQYLITWDQYLIFCSRDQYLTSQNWPVVQKTTRLGAHRVRCRLANAAPDWDLFCGGRPQQLPSNCRGFGVWKNWRHISARDALDETNLLTQDVLPG